MHQNNNVTIGRVNSNQACAACKYQRRKCPPDCILAPYFPHDRQKQFLNAHKLFGVSNITKIIRNLDQAEKDIAMRTIIFQSDTRASDPVGGCYRIIRQLQREIDYAKAELDLVHRQIAFCKTQAQAARLHQQQHQQQQIIQLAAVADATATDSSSSNPNNNYDIFSLDALASNEHPIITTHSNSNSNNNNNNNSVYHHTHHEDQEISLQELSDSWGLQPSHHVPIDNKIPSPTGPEECNDFKLLDFSTTNQSHDDLNFDYDPKIVVQRFVYLLIYFLLFCFVSLVV